MISKQTKNLLIDLKSKISQKYQLIEMRLFGSTARGENQEDSDIDIFVRVGNVNRQIEEGIFDLAYETELKYDCLIDIFVFDDKALDGIRFWTPVYQNIIREGVVI